MRYELTDHEWAAIRPMLPNKPRGVVRTLTVRWHRSQLAETYQAPRRVANAPEWLQSRKKTRSAISKAG